MAPWRVGGGVEVGEARVEVETCSSSDAPSWRRSEDGNGANTQKDRREEVEVTSPCKPVTIGKEVEKCKTDVVRGEGEGERWEGEGKHAGQWKRCEPIWFWGMEKMRTNLV